MIQFFEWQLPSVLILMLNLDSSLDVPRATLLAIPVLIVIGALYGRRNRFEITADRFRVCNGWFVTEVEVDRVRSITLASPPGFWAFYGKGVALRDESGHALAPASLATMFLRPATRADLHRALTHVSARMSITLDTAIEARAT